MNNPDLYKAARGYWTANAITGSIASELAALNREEAARVAEVQKFYSHYLSEKELGHKVGHYILLGRLNEAYDFLNESIRREITHDCQNQKEFKTHLTNLISQRKDKYRPFYQKIDRTIPEMIENMTAEMLCSIMSVKLMTPEELKQHHLEKKAQEEAEKFSENLGVVFRGILIIGLVILMICLSAQ